MTTGYLTSQHEAAVICQKNVEGGFTRLIYMRESSKETFDIIIPTHDPPCAQTPWFAHEQSDVKTYDYVSTTATSNKRDKRKSAGEMSMALRLGMRTVPLLGFIKRLHTRYQYPTPLEQFIIPQLEFHLEFTCRYQIFHPHGTIKFSTPMGQSIMIIIIIRASSSSRQSMRSCRISGVLTVDLSLVKHWVQIAEGNH